MAAIGATTISLVICGDDLHVVEVTRSPTGDSARAHPPLRRFLSMPTEDARGMLGGPPQRPITLTCPSAWCALRPIQVTRREWGTARDEILRSIDRLLPISPDDALAGRIDLVDESEEPVSARLIGVRRSQARPWLEAIERLFGHPVDILLSPHMAMLGLGLQQHRRAVVVEQYDGFTERHELRYGRPVVIGEPGEASANADAVVMLPGLTTGEAASVPPGVELISPDDLAIGAALAPAVAPTSFAPLIGKPPAPRPRWLAPATIAVAAIALLAISATLYQSRLGGAAEDAAARQRALQPDVERAQELRRTADRYVRLLDEGVGAATDQWRSVLPDLAEARDALSEGGFYQRVEVSSDTLALRGETESFGDLLERLEESPRFREAAPVSPVTKGQSGLDVFEVRAARRRLPGGVR